MQTQAMEQARTKLTASRAGGVAYVGAAAFATAAVWNMLVSKAITVAAAPQITPKTPLLQGTHTYFRWLLTTFPQERACTIAAMIGFGCLAVTASFTRDLLGRDRTLPRAGSAAITFGAALWVAGAILQLGGHRAIGMMATHANPILTVASIAFTIDLTGEAFALTAFALIGAGLIAYARAASQTHPQHRVWAGYTLITAALAFVIAATYATSNGNLTDLLLLAGGAIILPVWLIWTSRVTGRTA